jgi:ADP-ribose pyrophosphatase YjhB (NUDIX family)
MIENGLENKEIPERHGVIFVVFKRKKLQLEKRVEPNKSYFGHVIVPGEKIESSETVKDALKRGFREEFGARIRTFRKLGIIYTKESDGTLNIRHVYKVTGWRDRLGNPEGRNIRLEASFPVARLICQHPITQRILDLVEEDLSREYQ